MLPLVGHFPDLVQEPLYAPLDALSRHWLGVDLGECGNRQEKRQPRHSGDEEGRTVEHTRLGPWQAYGLTQNRLLFATITSR